MEPHVIDKPMARINPWLIVLSVVGAVVVGLAAFFLLNRHTRTIVGGLVSDPETSLQSTDGRTNIVFLGIGGEGHEAPDLTDSIILVSLRYSDHSITMVSLPRDIWVDTLKARINTAYHYGNEKRSGAGKDLAKSAVSEILGIPVHYALVLDFNGFIKAIDAVGGVDVQVEHTFDDYKYPIPGKENAEPESARYEHIHFDAGTMHMDGVTALKFARSRHAEGDEGTDFARGRRQQKIILAFKDKLLSSSTFLNKETLQNVFGSLQSSVDTNIQEADYGSFFRFFLAFQKAGSPSHSVDIDSYFVNPKNTKLYGGAWVLVPAKNWDEIHSYVQKSLE
jgi:LCP family protein required for cell wall assembly